MTKFIEFARRLRKDEDGATAIEYGLLAALIAVAIITGVGLLGDRLQGTFDEINDQFVAEGVPLPD
ncbi:Flp family type IVb pilin [Amaricoccus sp.]|uniref:Flp family type IVb pilin n=1 Tax=Amaricoccus sp. TaxID=1872485 RepID=UPI0025C0761D|nr:Flp family type IVb pilin [Amaricoccus sp.]